jgi:hypothetical protein
MANDLMHCIFEPSNGHCGAIRVLIEAFAEKEVKSMSPLDIIAFADPYL